MLLLRIVSFKKTVRNARISDTLYFAGKQLMAKYFFPRRDFAIVASPERLTLGLRELNSSDTKAIPKLINLGNQASFQTAIRAAS